MSDFYRLCVTVQGRNLKAVKRLWKKEYINERDNGWTVLHSASYCGSGDIVRYLLSEGCHIEDEVTVPYLYKSRPIHLAARYGNNEAVRVLIEGQCRLDCVTEDRQTPLDIAIQRGNTECQRILQEALNSGSANASVAPQMRANVVQKVCTICEDEIKKIALNCKHIL